jgi:hypothetical protein
MRPPRKTCVRPSRPQEVRRHTKIPRWKIWILPVTGLLALLWFLIRVIPKPSRAAYPCQRVAFPLASGFVTWLLGLVCCVAAFRKAVALRGRAHHFLAAVFVAAAVASAWLVLSSGRNKPAMAAAPVPNSPIGIAKGACPGRVVWIHDSNSTNWAGHGSAEDWFDDEHTDPNVVNRMLSRAIRALAGCGTDQAAWDVLFRYFNRSRGRGDVGYSPGQKIAVKINHTLCYNANSITFEQSPTYRDHIDNSPQLTIALLWQLVNVVGVAESDITIGDPGRITPNFFYDMLHAHFPNVRHTASFGGSGRTQAEFSDVEFNWSTPDANGKKQDYIPRSFAEADYFINFAILKSHDQGGITVCGKNHYGSLLRNPDGSLWGTRYNYYNMHNTLPSSTPGMGHYRALVDLMGHPQLGGKTLLCLVDGLFGGRNWDSRPTEWNMPPFNRDWPSSVFVSQDQVAVDSVCYDFLWAEWDDSPHYDGADDYLHEAALADNPPSGTFYDPNNDGIGLASLGAHEHWNNPEQKQYSRNLGTGEGIELARPVAADFNGDGAVDAGDLITFSTQWLQTAEALPPDIAPRPAGDGVVDMADFAVFAAYWGR